MNFVHLKLSICDYPFYNNDTITLKRRSQLFSCHITKRSSSYNSLSIVSIIRIAPSLSTKAIIPYFNGKAPTILVSNSNTFSKRTES